MWLLARALPSSPAPPAETEPSSGQQPGGVDALSSQASPAGPAGDLVAAAASAAATPPADDDDDLGPLGGRGPRNPFKRDSAPGVALLSRHGCHAVCGAAVSKT